MSKRKTSLKQKPGSSAIVLQQPTIIDSSKATSFAHLPLYVYAVTLSSLCIIIGLRWDISWHGSVGRDTFFTPPHVLVYSGAVLGGFFSGIQLLWSSFIAADNIRETKVKVWRFFYSSYGALFCIWGCLAMLTSAPFDNWWHNAFGLDITVVSPPHTVLGLGMLFLQLGACIVISKYLNKIEESNASTSVIKKQKNILRVLFVIAAASLLSMTSIWIIDYTDKRSQHAALFYEIIVLDILPFLPAFGRQLRMQYGMTLIAITYVLITCVTNWILQTIPVVPRLAPILNPVTHLQSLPFPLLLFIPAIFMDVILKKIKSNDWVKAVLMSVVFVLLLLAIQYPFSGFLLQSPGARNWFFGSDAWAYNLPPDWEFRYQYQPGEESTAPQLLAGILIAIVLGIIISRLSLRWGKWFQKIEK